MPKITVYLPEISYKRYEPYKAKINASSIVTTSLMNEVDYLETIEGVKGEAEKQIERLRKERQDLYGDSSYKYGMSQAKDWFKHLCYEEIKKCCEIDTEGDLSEIRLNQFVEEYDTEIADENREYEKDGETEIIWGDYIKGFLETIQGMYSKIEDKVG